MEYDFDFCVCFDENWILYYYKQGELMRPILFLILSFVTCIWSQDSVKTIPNIQMKGKEPVIINLKGINAHILIESKVSNNDNFSFKFKIRASKVIKIGAVCHSWKLIPINKNIELGKITLVDDNEAPNPQLFTNLDNIDEEIGAKNSFQFNQSYEFYPYLYTKININRVNKYSFYIDGLYPDTTIYELAPGLTQFNITFSLTAKCGFRDQNNVPQYPDTLYEGLISKDFFFENNNGNLSIVENKVGVK